MLYTFHTAKGPFVIVQRDNRWHVLYDGEDLGNYHSPRAAASDLSGGHTSSPGNGVDPGSLSIPEDLGEWEVSPK
jgi:hypothetical protein